MVRDLAGELNKQVLVDIEGGDVELDREMIEMIRDPLTHIVRNAVDLVEALSEPQPLRAAMGAGWERVGLGLIETEEGPLLLVDIAALIAGPANDRAAA